jgi:hypothetical protein
MIKTFPIELDEDLHKRAKIAAIQEGTTLHGWIINTLEEKLARHDNSRSSKEKRNANSQRNRSH